jgi:chaperonin GroES
MANVKPLGNRLLVKRSEVKTTRGGISLPETAQEKPKQGTVVALGEKVIDLKVGDQVYFTSYAGSEITVAGQTGHLILPIDDVLCVVQS